MITTPLQNLARYTEGLVRELQDRTEPASSSVAQQKLKASIFIVSPMCGQGNWDVFCHPHQQFQLEDMDIAQLTGRIKSSFKKFRYRPNQEVNSGTLVHLGSWNYNSPPEPTS